MPATISNFHQQLSANAGLAADDLIPVYDASLGTMGTITAGGLRSISDAIVSTTATTLTVTAALHAGRTVKIATAAPIAVTLPAATGTGNRYRFVFSVAATATTSTIKCVGTDDMEAGLAIWDTSNTDILALSYAATATDDTITFDGTTRSGVRGCTVDLEDIETGLWSVLVKGPATGSYATPLSATV
jgi:hypothetical protein